MVDLIRWGSLEPWKRELAEFVINAERNNKLIKSHYQHMTFEPRELAKQLMNGRFVWGVVNWYTVDRPNKEAQSGRAKTHSHIR